MTITGKNTYVCQLKEEAAAIIAADQFYQPWYDEKAAFVVEKLFPELQREDVTLNTDNGLVTFPHPNNGEDAERDLQEWLSAQMFWHDIPEIVWDTMPVIVRQLCNKIIEVNHG